MLVAEDRDEDIEILRLAYERANVNLSLHFVRNGAEAIEYLKGEGLFADRRHYPLPTILLLDLKMPYVNGFEVLEWIRLQPGLRKLIVIIFTSSNLVADIDRAFELGANSYLVKPAQLGDLEITMRHLEQYWIKINACPNISTDATILAKIRVLLRNPQTGQYFRGPGAWTNDQNEALNFEWSERAMQSAIRMKLSSFELIAETE